MAPFVENSERLHIKLHKMAEYRDHKLGECGLMLDMGRDL